MIVIYNNADKDPGIPADDLSMSDGNCKIIAPINNTTLFEGNATTPGAFVCSYPMTGWFAGGNWNNIVLANTGDCMRIVNTSGCEVFSVAYAAANANPMIYFSSGGSGANNVWYFNSGNPFLQSNWSEGCTNPANCGSNVQTPGLPNNAANQSFLNSLNNGCTPIPALSLAPQLSVNAVCGCNGSASVTASGSIPGYTYVWTPTPPVGQGTSTASSLCPGVYKCVVTSHIGCKDSLTFTIGGSVAINASVSGTNVLCFGDSSSTATASFTGGNGGITYNWSPAPGAGQGNNNPTGLSSQSYTVTVSDAAGCSDTAIFFPSQPPELLITSSITHVSCFGLSDGSVNISVSGGVIPYSFQWSNGATTEDINNLPASQNAFTVYDANNCLVRDTFVVTEPQLLTAAIDSTPVICNGQATGSAQVAVSGGTAGYSYSWQPSGGNDSLAVNLIAGTYSCTIVDANSCSTSVTTTVTQPPLLSATVSTTGAPCGGNSGSATALVSGGTPGYNYNWLPGNFTTPTAVGLIAGTYSLIVSDANSCSDTLIAIVDNINGPSVSIANSNSVTCFGFSNGVALADTSGGVPPYIISWSPVGGNSVLADSLPQGSYTVTITDANGCSAFAVASISQPSALSASTSGSDALCNGSADGSASVNVSGGTGNYTYTWSPSGGNNSLADSLIAGTYSVVVQDANNCSATASIIVSEPSPLSLALTSSPTTCGFSNGNLSASFGGGVPSYEILWTPIGDTSASVSGVVSGTYTCTLVDANNCSTFQTVSVAASSPATLSLLSSDSVSCFGLSDGAASVNANGIAPLSIVWLPTASTGSSVNGLSAGSYTCVVTDGTGCVDSLQVNIAQPNLLTASSSFTNVSCFGQSTGSASVVTSGGTPNYTYVWSPSGGNSASAGSLPAGNYTCTITDANNCQATASVVIAQPSQLSVTLSASFVNCYNPTGSISSSPSGGTPAYSYSWSPAASGSNPTGVPANTYTLVLSDALGCSVTQTVTIQADTISPGSNAGIDDMLSCLPGSSLSLNGTTSTAGVSYSWTGPNGFSAALPNPFINQSGTYTFTVTNPLNGCSSTDVVIISQLPGPTASILASPSSGEAPLSVSFVAGGTPVSNYQWDFGNGLTSTAVSANSMYANPGGYTVTLIVADAIGCTDTATQVILVNEPFSILIPNVFTPNGDGDNDVFSIPSTGLRDLNLQVFDRWGLLLAEITSINGAWDGKTQSGDAVPDGTYYFVIRYTDLEGNEGNAKGYLLLAR
jgi:gliding motility-associated-like protein